MQHDVTIEYRGQRYSLPVLLLGSAAGKIAHRGLKDQLDEAMDGRRHVVVLEGAQARSFHTAARSIAPAFARESADWGRLLVDLDAGTEAEPASLARMLERAS